MAHARGPFLFLMALLRAAACAHGAASPHLPPSQLFGDWLASCDNTGDCTIDGFGDGFGAGGGPATLILSRPRGAPSTIAMVLQPEDGRFASLRLQAPRRGPAVTVRLLASGPGTVRGILSAGEVAALLPALHGDGRITLFRPPAHAGGRPVAFGILRLPGAAAALDWVEQRQHRMPDPLPPIRPPPPAVDGPQPDPRRVPAAVSTLPALRACSRQEDGSEPSGGVAAWQLDPSSALWAIPCGNGNFDRDTLFVLAGTRGPAVPAIFPVLPQMATHPPGVLVDAEPGPDGRDIAATAPSRGLGDCGDFRAYRWDGSRFRLVLARLMTACRGLAVEDWPVVYRDRR